MTDEKLLEIWGACASEQARIAPEGDLTILHGDAALHYFKLQRVQQHAYEHLTAQQDRREGLRLARCFYARRWGPPPPEEPQ